MCWKRRVSCSRIVSDILQHRRIRVVWRILGRRSLVFFIAKKQSIPWMKMFRCRCSRLRLGYAVGRIGCLLSGDGDYGIPTTLPWGMSFAHGIVPTPPGCLCTPTPIYEFMVG